jgi:hypothetical protein
MDNLRRTPDSARHFRKTVAAGILALTAIAGCSGNKDDSMHQFIVEGTTPKTQEDLRINGGLNVRGSQTTIGQILGTVPEGTVVEGVYNSSKEWVVTNCASLPKEGIIFEAIAPNPDGIVTLPINCDLKAKYLKELATANPK